MTASAPSSLPDHPDAVHKKPRKSALVRHIRLSTSLLLIAVGHS